MGTVIVAILTAVWAYITGLFSDLQAYFGRPPTNSDLIWMGLTLAMAIRGIVHTAIDRLRKPPSH